MNNKERLSLILILTMLLAGCDAEKHAPQLPPESASQASPQSDTSGQVPPAQDLPASNILREDKSYVFVERGTDATDDGVARLIDKMAQKGLPFYQTAGTTNGLIARDDVVLRLCCRGRRTRHGRANLLPQIHHAVWYTNQLSARNLE